MIVLKAAQEKLLAALQSVAGIVERRHTLPILANVLMRKNGPDIEFTTSDLEIQVRTQRRTRRRCRQLRHHRGRQEADRHPARAAQRPDGDAERQPEQADAAGRQEPLHAADAAGRRLPARQRGGRLRAGLCGAAEDAARPDQPGALRDGGARHPLLPQRHPVHRRRQDADAGGHRRPPPGTGPEHARDRGAQAGGDPAAQDRARTAAPAQGRGHADRDALRRQPGQVQLLGHGVRHQAGRGQVPRLQPRDPEGPQEQRDAGPRAAAVAACSVPPS